MSEHTVISARKYDFVDKETKRQVSGVKITYLQPSPATKDSKGFSVINLTAPYEAWDDFHKVPGKYEIIFGQKADSKGKPTLVFESAIYVGPSE